MYTARILLSNSALLQIPAWSYSGLANCDEFGAIVTSNLMNAMDDVHHDYCPNREVPRFKQILLTFPKDYVLSAKEFNGHAGEGQELELEFLPIKYYPNPRNKNKETNSKYWAGFKVTRIDVKAHKRGKVESRRNRIARLPHFCWGGSGIQTG
jgi:hypothetical protein